MRQVVSASVSRQARRCARLALAGAALALAACGGNVGTPTQLSQAMSSGILVADNEPGVSPFISFVSLTGPGIPDLAAIEFTVASRPGSVSRPANVRYSMAALIDRGDVSFDNGSLRLPVFGLYAGYENQVSLLLQFQDGSTSTLTVAIATPAYVDPSASYGQPTIVKARAAGSALGFDFFVMKSALGSPVIVDTDAQIRWVAPGVTNSSSAAFQDDEFVIGDAATPTVYRLRLDGTLATSPLQSTTYTMFHHNIDPGRQGLLAEVDTALGAVVNLESTVAEINDQGVVLRQWDLAAILSAYMTCQGDDASAFVRPGADWFHNNATTYDPSDESIIVSSRENFVIKLDYATGNIIWILGDPTKYWYSFPSLRAKALTLAAGGLYPLGQHATTIISGGLLMLFNDGLGSVSQPAGAPAGASRTYSAVSAYSIDQASMTAQNVWNFYYGQTLYSKICSSAYEATDQSILVDYAVPDNYAQARLVGLDSNHDVVFDFQYPQDPTMPCSISWNALPIALDHLSIY